MQVNSDMKDLIGLHFYEEKLGKINDNESQFKTLHENNSIRAKRTLN
jgi:hypothetical protein